MSAKLPPPPPPPAWAVAMNNPLPRPPKSTAHIPDPPGYSARSRTKYQVVFHYAFRSEATRYWFLDFSSALRHLPLSNEHQLLARLMRWSWRRHGKSRLHRRSKYRWMRLWCICPGIHCKYLVLWWSSCYSKVQYREYWTPMRFLPSSKVKTWRVRWSVSRLSTLQYSLDSWLWGFGKSTTWDCCRTYNLPEWRPKINDWIEQQDRIGWHGRQSEDH